MRKIVFLGLLIFLSNSVTFGAEHNFVFEKQVTEPGVLQLSLEQAKVTIEQSEGNTLILRSSYPENITKPLIRQVGNNFTYTELHRQSLALQNNVISSEIIISIPEDFAIEINGTSITTIAQNLSNDIAINSLRLKVDFDHVSGSYNFDAGMGRFVLKQLQGNLSIRGKRAYIDILDSNLDSVIMRIDDSTLALQNTDIEMVDFNIGSGDVNIENVKMHDADIRVSAGNLNLVLPAFAGCMIDLHVETAKVQAAFINSGSAQFLYEVDSLGEITVNGVTYQQSTSKELNINNVGKNASRPQLDSPVIRIQSMTGAVHLSETKQAD